MPDGRAEASRAGGARLRRGIAAQGASLTLRLLSQLVQLPVLFAFWPVDRISAWFLLLGGLAYLGLIAQGTAAAGANRLAVPPPGAGPSFAPALFRQLRRRSLALTAVLTVGGGAACMLVSGTALAKAAGGPVQAFAAGALAGARLALVMVAEHRARAIAPDLFAPAPALQGEITRAGGKSLWTPALAFAAGPLVLGFNLQIYLVITSAFFGAAAVAALVATRTLVRVFDLVTATVSGLQFYETEHLSGDPQATQRRLVAGFTVLMLFLAAGAAALLLLVGPAVQRWLTAGETALDPRLALVLLAASAVRGLSASPAAALAAVNDHAAPTGWYAVGSAGAAVLAVGLAAAGADLSAVLMALVLAELAQLVPVARRASLRLGYPAGRFFRDLFSRERLADMAALAGHLRAGQRASTGSGRLPPRPTRTLEAQTKGSGERGRCGNV